jgi:hypothetical protein
MGARIGADDGCVHTWPGFMLRRTTGWPVRLLILGYGVHVRVPCTRSQKTVERCIEASSARSSSNMQRYATHRAILPSAKSVAAQLVERECICVESRPRHDPYAVGYIHLAK